MTGHRRPIGALLALCMAVPSAQAAQRIAAAGLEQGARCASLAIEADEPIGHRVFALEDPKRVVLDVEGLAEQGPLAALPSRLAGDDPCVRGVRVAWNRPGVVRIVFDLRKAARWQLAEGLPDAAHAHRLTLSLAPADAPAAVAVQPRNAPGSRIDPAALRRTAVPISPYAGEPARQERLAQAELPSNPAQAVPPGLLPGDGPGLPEGYRLAGGEPGERPPPGHLRALEVPRAATPPVIDGRVDEAVWKGAALADRFWISEAQRWPAEQTEVLVLADRERLYFAFRVYDSEPSGIESVQTRRDSGLGLDDQVLVQLDPYLSHREISSYSVNAAGTQDDAIAGGRARQTAWKGDWEAATQRTPYGWSVEIAIPFSILNFDPAADSFGVNFQRYHHRTGEWSRWADVTPRDLPEEMGRLTGLRVPAAGKEQPFTFMPYAIVGRNLPNKRGNVKDTLATAGIDIRYEPRQNLTGVLSLNPDFSQVESAITDINFNYNEKFRADYRPFFQEGSAYFGADTGYFYSNRVPDFDYGAKLFARQAGYQFGVLGTRAPDDRSDVAVRLEHEIDETHSLGGMVVATDRPDLRNALYVVRGRGREASGLNYSFDGALSESGRQPGDGSRLLGTLGWEGDHLSVGASADRYTQEYLPANGLLASDLPDTRGVTGFVDYYREFGEGPLREVVADVSWQGRDTGDDRIQRRYWTLGGTAETRNQIRGGLFYTGGLYRPVGASRGDWADEINKDHYWTALLDLNTRSSRFGYGASYSWGTLGGGNYEYVSPYAWVRPTRTTFVNVSTERLDSFGRTEQTVVSAGWDISARHGLVARFVNDDSGDSLRVAYSLHVTRNADFFAVYDDQPSADAKLSAKIVLTLP